MTPANRLPWLFASAALTQRWLPDLPDNGDPGSAFWSDDHGRKLVDELCVRTNEPRELLEAAWSSLRASQVIGRGGLLRELVRNLVLRDGGQFWLTDAHLWTWASGLLGGDLLAMVADRSLDPLSLRPLVTRQQREQTDEHIHFTAFTSRIAVWCAAVFDPTFVAPTVEHNPTVARRPMTRTTRQQQDGRAIAALLIDYALEARGRGDRASDWNEYANGLCGRSQNDDLGSDQIVANLNVHRGIPLTRLWAEVGSISATSGAAAEDFPQLSERNLLSELWQGMEHEADRTVEAVWWRYIALRSEHLAKTEVRARMSGLGEFSGRFAEYRRNNPLTWRVSADVSCVAVRSALPRPQNPRSRRQILDTNGTAVDATIFFSPHRDPPRFDEVGTAVALLRQRRDAYFQADALDRHQASSGETLPAVHGVDVVSKERGWHPLCWRPLYETASKLGLQLAMHVGEDMDDLLTGLRHIDEALDLFDALPRPQGLAHVSPPRDKPRLGHALAVRLDVRAWYARRGALRAQPWEHTLDLLWAWNEVQSDARRRRIENTCGARLHFCEPVSFAEIAGRYARGEPLCQCARTEAPVAAEGLIHLLCPPCYAPGEPDWGTHPDGWFDLVAHLQRKIRRRVGTEAIVEVCPTSNAHVSGLGWSWALDMGETMRPSLDYRVGSDDPGMLDTNVWLEHAKLISIGATRSIR